MASLCTVRAVRSYFLDGKLPPNGLECSVDEELFPKPNALAKSSWLKGAVETYSVDDMRLLEAVKELGGLLPKSLIL